MKIFKLALTAVITYALSLEEKKKAEGYLFSNLTGLLRESKNKGFLKNINEISKAKNDKAITEENN